MFRLFLSLVAFGCSAKSTDQGNAGDAGHSTNDTAAAEDTGISGPENTVTGAAVELLGQPGPECPDPSQRPIAVFDTHVGTGDWQNQWIPWSDLTAGRGWGLAVEDFNGDGHLDVLLPNLGSDELHLGDGTGHFIRDDDAIPNSVRDDTDVDTTGTAATDFDGDGDIDLYLANRGPDRLLRNRGDGTFEDVSEASGISFEAADSISAAWGHLDGDGLPDLFVSTYLYGVFPFEDIAAGTVPTADTNRLYRNLGDGQFEDISYALPDSARTTFAFVAGWHDIDLDGDADLIIVNDLGPIAYPNVVLRNDDGILVDIATETSLDVPIYGMGLGVGDVNGDMKSEFLFSSWDDLIWMESDGAGDWYENSIGAGLVSGWENQNVGWGTELADLNNDRWLDVMVPFGAHVMDPVERSYFESTLGLMNPDAQNNMVFTGSASGFVDVSQEWNLDDSAMSRVLLPADINNDGWLDLVGRSLDEPAALHMARCGDQGWLKVEIRDHAPNTMGLGVRVDLSLEGDSPSLTRTVSAGSTGIASSGPHDLHFGLGSTQYVNLFIRWLDGAETTIENVQPKQTLRITRL